MIKRGDANASSECVLLDRQCSLRIRMVNKRVRASASPECVLLGRQCSESTRTVIKRGDNQNGDKKGRRKRMVRMPLRRGLVPLSHIGSSSLLVNDVFVNVNGVNARNR